MMEDFYDYELTINNIIKVMQSAMDKVHPN